MRYYRMKVMHTVGVVRPFRCLVTWHLYILSLSFSPLLSVSGLLRKSQLSFLNGRPPNSSLCSTIEEEAQQDGLDKR